MTLKELEKKLLELSFDEQEQIISLLINNLGKNWQGIEKNFNICDGAACITNTRIPVWVLVEARRLGYSDADLLRSYPTITATDLVNAWKYAQAHSQEIEAAIKQNEEA